MLARMGAPIVCSSMPRSARSARCPAAVPPPWLPIAGKMKGMPPRSRTAATTARNTCGIAAMPRLPAVMAISSPGFTRSSAPVRTNSACTDGRDIGDLGLLPRLAHQVHAQPIEGTSWLDLLLARSLHVQCRLPIATACRRCLGRAFPACCRKRRNPRRSTTPRTPRPAGPP